MIGDRTVILAATILGSSMVFIDSTVINVALPALRADLQATLADQQWVVVAYLLTLGSLVLVGGSLGDLYGRGRVFTWGLIGFAGTSALCAIAPSAEVLIGLRALQGVAGALLVPSSLAILTEVFSESTERAAAIGSWTAWTSAAIAVGPPLGGLLVDAVSWRLVFAINIPIALVALWLIARSMPSMARDRDGGRVDFVGGLLCAVGLAGPVFALIRQPELGWGAPQVIGGLLGGVVVLAAFVGWEARHPEPMVPLRLFAVRNFAVGNLVTLGVYAGLGAATFFLTIYLQQVVGYGALAAGFALMPVTLIMVTVSRPAGRLSARIGPRLLMGLGPLIGAAGFAWWLQMGTDPDYLTDVLPGVLIFGLGLAATVAPLTAAVLAAVEGRHAGIASGVNNAVARVASLLAIAVVGAVVTSVYYGHGGDGSTALGLRGEPAGAYAFHWGMAISGLLMVAGGVVALIGIRTPRSTIQGT